MAITRTAMIDDDGSGTTGTILNNAWKQELYNQIDAIPAGPVPWTNIDNVTLTGTQPNWDPGIVRNTIITVGSTSGAVKDVAGFKPALPPYPGQIIRVLFVNTSPHGINFLHENAAATPGYRISTRNAGFFTISGFWGFAEFIYAVHAGIGGWRTGAFGNGQ